MMKSPLFNIRKSQIGRGMPGKSFTHILVLDWFEKQALSYLIHLPFFDSYVASLLVRYRKQKDREKATLSFVKFMATADAKRVDFLMSSRFFPRSTFYGFIHDQAQNAKRYFDLLNSGEELSQDDMMFLFNTRLQYGKNINIVLRNIISCDNSIQAILDKIRYFYLRIALRNLLYNRRGDEHPEHLRTDAWFAIQDMIDSYNPRLSKVPFHKYLTFFVKNRKNTIIKFETWGLKTGEVFNLGSFDENDPETDVEVSVQQVQKEMETNLYQQKVNSERYALLDVVMEPLLKPFKTIVQLYYGIIDPFSLNEEVQLLFNQGEQDGESCASMG